MNFNNKEKEKSATPEENEDYDFDDPDFEEGMYDIDPESEPSFHGKPPLMRGRFHFGAMRPFHGSRRMLRQKLLEKDSFWGVRGCLRGFFARRGLRNSYHLGIFPWRTPFPRF